MRLTNFWKYTVAYWIDFSTQLETNTYFHSKLLLQNYNPFIIHFDRQNFSDQCRQNWTIFLFSLSNFYQDSFDWFESINIQEMTQMSSFIFSSIICIFNTICLYEEVVLEIIWWVRELWEGIIMTVEKIGTSYFFFSLWEN